MSETVKGGCMCGDYSYQFNRDSVISAHHCHCRDCQQSTGSGKATIVLVPTDALETQGDLKTYTVTGTEGAHVSRGFCANCGSPVLSFVEEAPALRIIKAGSLQDSSWLTIDSSFWSDSAKPWSPVDIDYPWSDKNPTSL